MNKAKQKLPFFTVLMPVYNAEKFLAEAVESVLSQTLHNFEFLIINDGSTDSSLDILRKYAKKDERIRLITRANKGFVATLDEGLQEAKTDIIARMDADDISLPQRFEQQYKYLMDNEAYSIVGCQLKTISEKGVLGALDPRPTMDRNLKLFLAYGCSLSGPTVMFKKDTIGSVGGFRQDAWPAEDYDCWERVFEKDITTKIYILPEVLYLYRENTQGISNTNKVAQIQKTIEVGSKFREYALDRGWTFLTYNIHKGWFNDLNHIKDETKKEDLKRIYYAIQVWFINDELRNHPVRANFHKLKLKIYTMIINPQNKPYIYNQPKSHTFPYDNEGV